VIELSLVMASTNDDYGNVVFRNPEPAVPTPLKERSRFCFYTLHEAFKNVDYEIVFVEWGSHPDRPPLVEEWEFLYHPRVSVIQVPQEFAQKICPEKGFHETHAKNIGIRRAKGDMILSINNDCLWLDKFPRDCLKCDGVMVANRPTVYHTVLECGLDIDRLKEFCSNPENIVHATDWNSNGDFTLMPRELWFKLQGLSTPKADMIAGIDMWQIHRAEQLTGRVRYVYPHSIIHLRHPGVPLGSSWGQTIVADNWGFPNIIFKEYTGE
jgi:hypothetical protein